VPYRAPVQMGRASQPAGHDPTERFSSTPVALANMFPPGILYPMLRRAGNASNQMTHTVEIESPPHFSVNQVTHKGRFASFLCGGATSQCLALFCWKTDSQCRFHMSEYMES